MESGPKRAEPRFQSRTVGRRQGKSFARNQLAMNSLVNQQAKQFPITATLPSKRNGKKILKNNQVSDGGFSFKSFAESKSGGYSSMSGSRFSRIRLFELILELGDQNSETRESASSIVEDICGPFSSIDPELYANNMVLALCDVIVKNKTTLQIPSINVQSLEVIALSLLLEKSEVLFEYCSMSTLNFLCRRIVGVLENSSTNNQTSGQSLRKSSQIMVLILTNFQQRLQLTWKELNWIIEKILDCPDQTRADSDSEDPMMIVNLKVQVLKNMTEFVVQLGTLAVSEDGDLVDYFTNQCSASLFNTLLKSLQSDSTHVVVLKHIYQCFRELLPYISESLSDSSSLQSVISCILRDFESLPDIYEGQNQLGSSFRAQSPTAGSKDVQDSTKNEQVKKNRTRNHITQEIVATEEDYLRSLSMIIDKFLVPLRKNKILSGSVLSRIFSNIEMLADFHKLFLEHLKKSQDSIPSIVLQYADFLKMYTPYINDYGISIETICQLKNHSAFQAFLLQAAPGSGEAELMSLLIKPVQRIPRYLLLLKELEKCTDSSHTEFEVLAEAIEKISKIASHVNMSKRRVEDFTKLIHIQSHINARFNAVSNSFSVLSGKGGAKRLSLIKPHRYLVREGNIVKKATKGFRRSHSRHFYLFNDSLLWTTISESRPKVQGFIELSNATVETHIQRRSNGRGSHFLLDITTSGNKKTVCLLFGGREERDEWNEDITKAIEGLQKSRSHRHQGIHHEKDVASVMSVSPSRSMSIASYSSCSQSTTYTSECSVYGEDSSLSNSVDIAECIITTLCYTMSLFQDFMNPEMIENIDSTAIALLTDSNQAVLSHVLEFWLFRFSSAIPISSNSYQCLQGMLELIPQALTTFRDEGLEVPYICRKDYDLDGFPLASNSWGDRLVVFLTMFNSFQNGSVDHLVIVKQFIERHWNSGDWKLKGSAVLALGIFNDLNSKSLAKECIEILCRQKTSERRLVEGIVWMVQRNSANVELWDVQNVYELLRGLVSVSNRLILSMESDVKIFRNISVCLSTMVSCGIIKDAHVQLVEVLLLNLVLHLSELNHNSSRKDVFECFERILVRFPSLCSNKVVCGTALPKLIDYLPESSAPLSIIISQSDWNSISHYTDAIMEVTLKRRMSSIVVLFMQKVPRGFDFISICKSFHLSDWISLRIRESTRPSDEILEMSIRFIEEFDKEAEKKYHPTILKISNSLVYRMKKCNCRSVPLLIKLCNTMTKHILRMGTSLTSVCSELIQVLHQHLCNSDIWSKVTSEAMRIKLILSAFYCLSAMMDVKVTMSLSQQSSFILECIETVFGNLIHVEEVFAISLTLLGDLISIRKTDLFSDSLQLFSILPHSLAQESDEIRENSCYVLREIAVAVFHDQNKNSSGSTEILIHLFHESQYALSKALTAKDSGVRQKAVMFLCHTVIALGEEFMQFVDNGKLLDSFMGQFPVLYDSQLHLSKEEVYEDNLLFYRALSVFINLKKQKAIDSSQFIFISTTIYQRLPRLVECALTMKESENVSKRMIKLASSLLSDLTSADRKISRDLSSKLTIQDKRLLKLLI